MTYPDGSPSVVHISARDNALLKDLRRLAQETTAYRKQGRVWIEGDHLCRAALQRGQKPGMAIFCESFWPIAQHAYAGAAPKLVVLKDTLFAELSVLESPARMGFLLDLPEAALPLPGAATVVLDRVQDAGNVGSILRSASAFGYQQVIALKGTAALWSPKVLRAGMGAHFALRLVEAGDLGMVQATGLPLLVTSSHGGSYLHQAHLPWPCAWVMGHEGQGVAPELEALAAQRICIAQPGGEESLNVAAAAAICLHASAAQRG